MVETETPKHSLEYLQGRLADLTAEYQKHAKVLQSLIALYGPDGKLLPDARIALSATLTTSLKPEDIPQDLQPLFRSDDMPITEPRRGDQKTLLWLLNKQSPELTKCRMDLAKIATALNWSEGRTRHTASNATARQLVCWIEDQHGIQLTEDGRLIALFYKYRPKQEQFSKKQFRSLLVSGDIPEDELRGTRHERIFRLEP